MKKDTRKIPVREIALMFNYYSSCKIPERSFMDVADPVIAEASEKMHKDVLYDANLDFHKKEDIDITVHRLFDEVLIYYNDDLIHPFRYFIDNCCLVTHNKGKDVIHLNNNYILKEKIARSGIINQILMAIRERNPVLYNKANENSEFLIYDIAVFTKFAPLAFIDGKGNHLNASLIPPLDDRFDDGNEEDFGDEDE